MEVGLAMSTEDQELFLDRPPRFSEFRPSVLSGDSAPDPWWLVLDSGRMTGKPQVNVLSNLSFGGRKTEVLRSHLAQNLTAEVPSTRQMGGCGK